MTQFAKKRASNVFRKEREQYVEIQDLKAQMQDKNMAISELKKLVEKCKGKSVDTKFDKPSVVRQPNAQRIPKPSVLGKPAPFSDSLERKNFAKKKSVPKTNEFRVFIKNQSLTEFTRQQCKLLVISVIGIWRLHSDIHTCFVRVLRETTLVSVIADLISIIIPSRNNLINSNQSLAIATPTQHGSLASKTFFISNIDQVKLIKSKTVPSSKGRLNLLCFTWTYGVPMRVASINGQKIYSDVKNSPSVANDTSGLVLQRQKGRSDYDNPDPATNYKMIILPADDNSSFTTEIYCVSSSYSGNSNCYMQSTSKFVIRWDKDTITQVRGNPSKPVQTRRQLATDPEMCGMSKKQDNVQCHPAEAKIVALSASCAQVISYALSWKPCQGDSLNLPDHRIHKDGDGDASF
ncbi:hypothetical protein Tco_1092154 [Tanacetum coccineum]|uniref:Uncharacterized protein n=1 Tax=Tanacetum coccineum TaxID=301880 RepID=A0ABQ5I955_9ASTR